MGWGAVIGAIIGAASSAHSSSQQRKQSKQTRALQQQQAEQAKEEEKLIRDASAAPETATIAFGKDNEEELTAGGSFSEFMSPVQTGASGVGTPKGATSGLGFGV